MAVQMRTMLEVADNSGARKLQMILPLGGGTGKILFEMEGVPRETAVEAMRLASNKLPLKTKFVSRASQH